MSSIRHPKAKKDASLARDHRVYAQEGEKSFRGVWKKKKRRKAKQARVCGRMALSSAIASGAEDAPVVSKQPKTLQKIGVVSLERDLEIKAENPHLRFSAFNYAGSKFTK